MPFLHISKIEKEKFMDRQKENETTTCTKCCFECEERIFCETACVYYQPCNYRNCELYADKQIIEN